MSIAGIDCGKQGAIVVIDGPSFAPIVHAYPVPVLGKGRKEYDVQAMRSILKSHSLEHVALERQQTIHMPSRIGNTQGAIASFSIGMSYGLWMGLLVGLSIPFETVSPQVWQKAMFEGVSASDTKAKSALVAQRLYPNVDCRRTARCKTPSDGITDALCIAEWARRRLSRGKVA